MSRTILTTIVREASTPVSFRRNPSLGAAERVGSEVRKQGIAVQRPAD